MERKRHSASRSVAYGTFLKEDVRNPVFDAVGDVCEDLPNFRGQTIDNAVEKEYNKKKMSRTSERKAVEYAILGIQRGALRH